MGVLEAILGGLVSVSDFGSVIMGELIHWAASGNVVRSMRWSCGGF
jgi:hypothetical protein